MKPEIEKYELLKTTLKYFDKSMFINMVYVE